MIKEFWEMANFYHVGLDERDQEILKLRAEKRMLREALIDSEAKARYFSEKLSEFKNGDEYVCWNEVDAHTKSIYEGSAWMCLKVKKLIE